MKAPDCNHPSAQSDMSARSGTSCGVQHTAQQPMLPTDNTETVTVACAINQREQDLFFPEGVNAEGCRMEPVAPDAEGWATSLRQLNPQVLLSGWSTPALPQQWLQQPDCRLRYVCNVTGSIRRVVPRTFIEQGGLVSNWGGLCAPTVAEHALLLALSALRNQPGWHAFMQMPNAERHWTQLRTHTLYGRKVGIHGFGHVARALIRLLRPFGVTLSAYSAGVPRALMDGEGVQPADSLASLFSNSEIVFECEALTPQSENAVDAAMLARLADDSVFVNVGRGRVVCEQALRNEVSSGRLRIAVDVCTSEPHYASSGLPEIPQLILSPHIAGPTLDQLPLIGRLALDNLSSYLATGAPLAAVSLEVYDRST